MLHCYRKLYRTCQRVFHGDPTTLHAAKRKLKAEFLKNSEVVEEAAVEKLVQEGLQASQFLQQHVVQAVESGEKLFRMRFNEDHVLANNLKPVKRS